MIQVSVFDQEASTYDQWYETPLGNFVDRVERACALELLAPSPGMKVLDAGCGTGNFSLTLAKLGCRVTGVDTSIKMLEAARDKAESMGIQAEFTLMDVAVLDYPEDTFDAVVSMAALEFFEDRRRAIDELFRVLKPGGSLLIGTINRESDWGELYSEIAAKQDSVFRHARFVTENEMRALVPKEPEAFKECLFIHPGAKEEEICEEAEKAGYERGRGGFMCFLWRK